MELGFKCFLLPLKKEGNKALPNTSADASPGPVAVTCAPAAAVVGRLNRQCCWNATHTHCTALHWPSAWDFGGPGCSFEAQVICCCIPSLRSPEPLNTRRLKPPGPNRAMPPVCMPARHACKPSSRLIFSNFLRGGRIVVWVYGLVIRLRRM